MNQPEKILEGGSMLLQIATILISLLSLIYTSGIVWRVEKKLDTAYKLFLSAIVFFLSSEILNLVAAGDPRWMSFSSSVSRFIFAALLLSGILEMRSLIQKLDGEK